ncbi:DNA repair protein RecN [Allobranchiibius sp. GilTou38]|uniref:DNA repair protein RecN n=1 Tax=Allobranchiibius sp. GilTou38 TaxID=2815210 RepID=UPI001AA1B21D|nr:DNA repair protein RecN [Allobranchiibius sp. GilTou38]MBO1766211.1 DNA repair protein RecN [Allobranchiibius sp. GilTou38]
MLQEIHLRGLGVIEDALLELSDGLNVVTGETGAGKTMVVQGLGLLLGGRADPGLVRAGSGQAVVEGVVQVADGDPALARALEAGADGEDAVRDGLVLVRSVSTAGRSRAHVGGRTAPIGVLAEIGEHLVAVHGQADQWRLQRPDQHRAVLDEFGGTPLARTRAEYVALYEEWTAVRAEVTTLREESRERAQRLELLTAGLEEIAAVDPQPGEDDDLAAQSERMLHVDALREAAAVAHAALVGDDDDPERAPYVVDLVSHARQSLAGEGEHDVELAGLADRLREIGILAGELGADLGGYLAGLDIEPGRLEAVQQRRAALGRLTRKYGADVAEVLAWAKDAAASVDALAGSDDRIAHLDTRLGQLATQLVDAADALTAARRTAATTLQEQVAQELTHLAMGAARIEVVVTPTPGEYTGHGVDRVEIMLAANKGAALRNLAKAASGGELSRVMLALEVVTGSGAVPTFVFDEVDAGVGGAAALDVGARLQRLAEHAQVIVVTHLAQVAAYADRHLVVRKESDGQVTQSDVAVVEGEDRLAELARMLGGVSDSQVAQDHARELLDAAQGPRSRGTGVSATPVGRRRPVDNVG